MHIERVMEQEDECTVALANVFANRAEDYARTYQDTHDGRKPTVESLIGAHILSLGVLLRCATDERNRARCEAVVDAFEGLLRELSVTVVRH